MLELAVYKLAKLREKTAYDNNSYFCGALLSQMASIFISLIKESAGYGNRN